MNDPTADSHALRRELAELRSRLAGLERWRKAVRSALATLLATPFGDEMRQVLDALHDATDDEGAPDLAPRTTPRDPKPANLTVGVCPECAAHGYKTASPVCPRCQGLGLVGTSQPPTERLTRLGGSRPGLEEESPGGC